MGSKFSNALSQIRSGQEKERARDEATNEFTRASKRQVEEENRIALTERTVLPETRLPDPPAPPEPPAIRGPGRPKGKSSDPDFRKTTLVLRRNTIRAAMRKLDDEGANVDLSDLVERLLSLWVKRRS